MERIPCPAEGLFVGFWTCVYSAYLTDVENFSLNPYLYKQPLGYRQAANPPPPTWSAIKEDQLIGYSAHWDIRSGVDNSMEAPYVRLLATQIGGAGFNGFGFTCHFFFENGTRTNDVHGAARAFGRRGWFIFCPAKELATPRKVVTHRQEQGGNTTVVSYEVDVPASVSIGCAEDKKCEGHWTFQVGTYARML